MGLFYLPGCKVTRRDLGLPHDWKRVESWCRTPFQFNLPLVQKAPKITKFDGIDFSADPDPKFWDNFPKRDLPDRPTTRVNVGRLEEMVKEAEATMTIHERDMAYRAIDIMKNGAPAHQIRPLPGATMKNAPSINKCGPVFTETLETWLIEGHVAGPFMEAPLADLRLNSLMAEEQKDKIRPVLNMSNPKGKSFNDNVDENSMGRTSMSSAKQFGQALLASGKDSVMSKTDLRDAYKLIPAKPDGLGLKPVNRWFLLCELCTCSRVGLVVSKWSYWMFFEPHIPSVWCMPLSPLPWFLKMSEAGYTLLELSSY
jgi:hypothetical protein